MAPLKKKLAIAVDRMGIARPPFHLRHWRWLRLAILLGADIVIVAFSYWAAFALRLEDMSLGNYGKIFITTLPIALAIHALSFAAGGMYRQVWRYANFNSAVLIVRCVFIGTLLMVVANFFLVVESRPPRSVPIIFALLAMILVAFCKFSWRAWETFQLALLKTKKPRCLIYGAGSAGDLLARHIAANPNFPYAAIGYIDDDHNKRGRVVHGLPILGTGEDLKKICTEKNVTTIIFAMHAPSGKVLRSLVTRCHDAGVKPLMMPDMAHSLGSEVIQLRSIDIKDLLQRSPKSIDRERVSRFFEGHTVLITGAGGSIGAEICRQIAECHPRRLVLCDSSEYNLYKIEQELRDLGVPASSLTLVLGSVVNPAVVERLFNEHKPHYVLHAAAYKHVPMVENNPTEGLINNVKGTKLVAEAAIRHGVDRFLLVSTDKAVRPTNVMGATKRCCELLVQALNATAGSKTRFCAVRFGNVLGSSGSVIPRFMNQIQAGGPVTVTHPEMTRFFMLISEAVGLVLQSITMSEGGEIFVLDMGEPVKISDMAKELIILSGKSPGKDIEIVYTGVRPGEKLYEELILEGTEKHKLHDNVYTLTATRAIEPAPCLAHIDYILQLAEAGDAETSRRLLLTLAEASLPAEFLDNASDPSALPMH